MVRTMSLDEDKHAVKMLQNLKQMKCEETLCDFTITVQTQQYQAHRPILSAGSPYFKAMLKHDTKENREGKVDMKNVDAECVKSCIDFMYSGKFDIPDGKISDLLHVAIMMQLDDVKESIRDILDKELNAVSFYETRWVAEMYNLPTLSARCKAYSKRNIMAISTQEGFENETKSDIITIFKSKKFKLREEDKLTILMRWLGRNFEKKQYFVELINIVNLDEIGTDYLNDLLETHSMISDDLQHYKLISSALVRNMRKGHASTSKLTHNMQDSSSRDSIVVFDWYSDSLKSYDPVTGEMTKFHHEHFKHLLHFTAVSIDSYIFVICGHKSVYRLNLKDKTTTWQQMTDMIADHGLYPPSVEFSGYIFVIGSSALPENVVERYDPVANHWLRLDNKPEGVAAEALVSLNDSIYCIGGMGSSNNGKKLCKFTPSNSQWVDLQPMRNGRRYCGAVAVGQRIFVTGGLNYVNAADEIECYDIIDGQWTSMTSMIKHRMRNFAHHINGSIFSFAIVTKSDSIEKYDIASDSWCEVNRSGSEHFQVYSTVLVHD